MNKASAKPPVRLVIKNGIVYGYRGHPTRYVELECGHYIINRWDALSGKESKLVPGKSKCKCWECIKPTNPQPLNTP